jgi:hypothetical protein
MGDPKPLFLKGQDRYGEIFASRGGGIRKYLMEVMISVYLVMLCLQ